MDVIKVDPEIMHGTPCFAGTRVPVRTLFEDFPSVTREQVNAILELASERVIPASATP
jgi:uncharacterized protein (DUF433 family)